MNELLDDEVAGNGKPAEGDVSGSQERSVDFGPSNPATGKSSQATVTEEFPIEISTLFKTVENLLGQRNVRRIILKEKSGEVLAEISPKFGVVLGLSCAALLPVTGALAAIGELIAEQAKGRRRGFITQQDLLEAGLVGSAVAAAFLPVAVGVGMFGVAIANLILVVEKTESP